MPGHLPNSLEIGEMLAMLAVVGAMYSIVVTLMLLVAELRQGVPRWLRGTLARMTGLLRLPR
jgi:hypothetical protein